MKGSPMRNLLVCNEGARFFFFFFCRDIGDIIEVIPVAAGPDRNGLGYYHLKLDNETVVFPLVPGSELDAFLFMALNSSIWLWVTSEGEIEFEISKIGATNE